MKNTKYLERRSVISQTEAMPILARYGLGLTADFKAAWEWVQAVFDQDHERRLSLDPSTQAAMVYDRFIVLMRRRYSTEPQVTLKSRGRMVQMRIEGKVCLRFKKLDDKLRSKNVKTNSQLCIYYQMSMLGLEKETEITFGYRTDITGRKWVGLYFTCPVGWGYNKWVIPVDEEGGEEQMFTFAPIDGSPDVPPTIEPKEKRKVE